MYHGGSVTLPGSVLLKRADQIVPVRTYVSFRWVRLRVCVVFWLPLYGGDHGGASPRGGVRLRDFSSSQLAQSHTVAIGLLSLRTGQLLYYGKYVAIANTEVSIALPITSVATSYYK